MLSDLDFKREVFKNRDDGITKLLSVLPAKKIKDDNWLIIVASEMFVKSGEKMAEALEVDYDFLFTEYVFAPNNSECIIACVSETQEIVLHSELIDSFGISLDFVYADADRKYEDAIVSRVYKYRKGESVSSLKGRKVLILDEGCETGIRAMTCIKTIINGGAKAVAYAAPVLASNVFSFVEKVADEVFYVYKILDFVGADFYYQTLDILEKESILDIIKSSKRFLPFKKQEIN
ncbi:MAG: sodium:proton antiporter [Sulfurospirillaceae bacterium]|nr:sodium:proton antiporter [Sulfurospirillaceae bacterium]